MGAAQIKCGTQLSRFKKGARMIKIYLAASSKASEHDIGVSLAHYALRETFKCDAPLLYDSRGKPYFDLDGVYVSISHSHERCMAAISDSEIGADIEYHSSDAEKLTKLAKRYFTEKEAEYVKAQPCERFYEIWCAKESFIKYTGEGFSRPLSSFCVTDSELCFTHFNYDGYTLCVCSKTNADTAPIFLEKLSPQQ